MRNVLFNIVLCHDIVSENAAAFALAAALRYPVEPPVCPFGFAGGTVFQIRPVRKSRHQRIIADVFRLLRLIAVLSGFGLPVSAGEIVTVPFIELDSPVDVGEGDGVILFNARPENRKSHDFIGRFFRGEGFAEHIPSFRAVHVFRACRERDKTVARAVGEETPAVAGLLPRDRVACDDGGDA